MDEHKTAQERIDREGVPTIIVTGRYTREITTDALGALTQANEPAPRLFRRGTQLVRIRLEESPSAEAIGPAALRGLLDRSANFTTEGKGGILLPSSPPDRVVADILTLPGLPFPNLAGIVKTPVFHSDGTLAQKPGYHAASGLYLAGDLVDLQPDLELGKAVSVLQDLLGDFPFADEASRTHAYALFIAPFVRYLINGPTPLNLIDAPTPGNGKDLLFDVSAMVALGGSPEAMGAIRNEDEMEKRITALLLEGHPMIGLTNVSDLKSPNMSAVLTRTEWTGRILGKSQMVRVPNRAIWVATGNNVVLSDEMLRRTVHIRLDAGVERPEDRKGWRHPALLLYAREHRAEGVRACLSLVKAWIDAGMVPWSGARTLGSFEEWVRVTGGILENAGLKDFLGNRKAFRAAADRDTEEWRAFCSAWWSTYAAAGVTAKQLLDIAVERSMLVDLRAGRNALSAMQRIGHALSARRDRIFGQFRISSAGRDSVTGSQAYCLQEIAKTPKTPESPGDLKPEARGFDSGPSPNPRGANGNGPGVPGVSVVSVVSGSPPSAASVLASRDDEALMEEAERPEQRRRAGRALEI